MTVATIAKPIRSSIRNKQKFTQEQTAHNKTNGVSLPPTVDTSLASEEAAYESANHWPLDILEAYRRPRGPYTLKNAETLIDEEPVELYNGWLVWQEMTHLRERKVVATLQDMLSISARKVGFGQALPDQVECFLSNGDTIKPDACLISWRRIEEDVVPYGPKKRPTLMGAPELIIEVRSPSNRRVQEQYKRQLYFENGTEIVWDVDEENKIIWVYHVESPLHPTRFGLGDELDCQPFLPSWRRRIDDIFTAQATAETVVGEVAQAWREEGIEIGKEQGIEEGMARTLREMLPMMAQMRFGNTLPSDLSLRLQQCSLATLQQLQATLPTSATVEAWLATVR